MKLELPMVVTHIGDRLIQAELPGLGLWQRGTSMAAIRDDLALEVMIAFEGEGAEACARYQLPPHMRLRQITVDTVARDRAQKKKLELKGKLSVLLEKWPLDEFWVATPLRLRAARFAVRDLDALDKALARRIGAWCLAQEPMIESLESFVSSGRERLDVLEVDADPPTILPRSPRPPPRRPGKKKAAPAAAVTVENETPAQREERRRRRRLGATTLRAAARNLSHGLEDGSLERAYGRDALVESLVDELYGREGVALVLVGESGAGKTALVHELTRRLGARQAAAGQRRDLWRIDGGRFIAGQSYVGQWEARARALVAELADTADILYADDLASLVYAGRTRSSNTNLAQFLEAQLARGEITMIAESTPERLARVREEAPTFASLFRVVEVPALSPRQTLPVLLGVVRELEGEAAAGQPPRVEPQALESVLAASERFRPGEAFPGKAVRLLRRVMTSSGRWHLGRRTYGAKEVLATLRTETGLPPFVLGAEPPREREAIRRELAGMVAGQPEAIDAITDVVLTMQAGLGDRDKPLATMLLVGPTGVGKTETAKALSRYLFGSAERLVRFDMSELMSSGSLARLVGEPGAPDGELTTALRSQPFRVILFDEVEKAHPRVFDALLQLLGEGRLTDAAGRTADARQAVILMTSNLGVREAASRPGFVQPGDQARQHYLSAVRAFFRPEFFNRIDRVVPYGPLDRAALGVVVEHALEDLLGRRGIRRGHVLVDVEPELLELLVEQAFDPRYGARPLKRALERRLTVPLAHHLVTRRGDDLALVEMARRGEEMALSVRLLADAAPITGGDDDPDAWPLARLAEEAERLRELAAAIADEPAAAALGRARTAALARGENPPPEATLLDGLLAARARLDELDADELDGVAYVEELDGRSAARMHDYDAGRAYRRNRGHGGLRPRAGYREVPRTINPELSLRRVRPIVRAARDELDLLAHRLRGLGGGVERLALLFECVGAPAREAMESARGLTLPRLLRPERWEEVVDERGDAGWRHVSVIEGQVKLRRIAYAYEGPGLGELLAALTGWALIDGVRDGVPITMPVRVELLDGEMPGAVIERDRRFAAERERRRVASAAEPLEPGVVITRRRGRSGEAVHVPTGRNVSEEERIAAAIVRSWRT